MTGLRCHVLLQKKVFSGLRPPGTHRKTVQLEGPTTESPAGVDMKVWVFWVEDGSAEKGNSVCGTCCFPWVNPAVNKIQNFGGGWPLCT